MASDASSLAYPTAGVCTLCNSECDGAVEEVHRMMCTSRCTDTPQLYHTPCLAKFIRSGPNPRLGCQGSVPDSGFSCPREGCKGRALHCNVVVVKKKKKAPPPQLPRGPSPKPSLPACPKKARPMGQRQPQPQQPAVVRLPPVPQAPKADPLGRKLNTSSSEDAPRELPPGYELAEPAGKANAKNAKRAAKRREALAAAAALEAGSSMSVASDGGASASVVSGVPGSSSHGFGGSGGGGSSGAEAAALMGRFITDVERFNALAGLLASSDDDEPDSSELCSPQLGAGGGGGGGGHVPDSGGGFGSFVSAQQPQQPVPAPPAHVPVALPVLPVPVAQPQPPATTDSLQRARQAWLAAAGAVSTPAAPPPAAVGSAAPGFGPSVASVPPASSWAAEPAAAPLAPIAVPVAAPVAAAPAAAPAAAEPESEEELEELLGLLMGA